MEKFLIQSIVFWQYTHHLNDRSSIEKVKKGVYRGLVKHREDYRGEQLALVSFCGNRTTSRIPLNELFSKSWEYSKSFKVELKSPRIGSSGRA